jgi:hypothetical protein
MTPGFYSGLQLNMFPLFGKESRNFPKTEQASCNFYLCQKDDMEQVPYWGPIILEWLVNHTVVWYFLHDALEVILNFECKGKKLQ